MGAHSTPRRSGRGRPQARKLKWRGRGTCTSPENFGSDGEAPPPPHPLHLQTRQTQGEELQGNPDTQTKGGGRRGVWSGKKTREGWRGRRRHKECPSQLDGCLRAENVDGWGWTKTNLGLFGPKAEVQDRFV